MHRKLVFPCRASDASFGSDFLIALYSQGRGPTALIPIKERRFILRINHRGFPARLSVIQGEMRSGGAAPGGLDRHICRLIGAKRPFAMVRGHAPCFARDGAGQAALIFRVAMPVVIDLSSMLSRS
jgi:hypothetical protein